MLMISAYKFRLYPDEEQEKTLDNQLRICKELYNGAYYERLKHYEKTGRGLTYAEQAGALPEMKKENPELATVHSQGPAGCPQETRHVVQELLRGED